MFSSFFGQTLGFATPADVDVWLLANPFRALGAIHFVQLAGGGIGYGLQTNSTAEQQRGIYQDPTFFMQVPLQVAAERELARHLTQGQLHSHTATCHPSTPSLHTRESHVTMGLGGWVVQIGV